MRVLALLAQATLLGQDASPEFAAPASAEIVVWARRTKCVVELRGHELSRAELDWHMRGWAQGVPVRVRAPERTSYRCLSRILFKLSDHGVRTVEFVDPGR